MTQAPVYRPGLEGIIAGETAVSFIDAENVHLYYRGHDVRPLALQGSFEEVAYLVLHGELPTKKQLQGFEKELFSQRSINKEFYHVFSQIPKESHPMAVLQGSIPIMGVFDPDGEDNGPEANQRKAIRLIAKIPTVIANSWRIQNGDSPVPPSKGLGHAANFLYMLWGKKPPPRSIELLNKSQILYQEHGFNASTFTARVTASTLSNLHYAMSAAVGTLKGPLHGRANEKVMETMLQVKTPDKAEKYVLDALARHERIMGFGHRVYKKGDPRSAILKDLAWSVCEEMNEMNWCKLSEVMERVMEREKGIKPNVDYYSAIAYYTMGLPLPLYTPLFAMARSVGWSAHIMEQLANNRLIRPRSKYIGPKLGRAFVPLEKR